MLKSYIRSLQEQLERVKTDREHLDDELRNAHAQVEEEKQRSVIRHCSVSNRNKQRSIFLFTIIIISKFDSISFQM